MTPQELRKFLFEEVPRIREWQGHGEDRTSIMRLLSALDAAVGLLGEAITTRMLSTLRLVVGEKEP